MLDDFTRFIRSNSIYSKTADEVHVAWYNDAPYVFIEGMPMKHSSFLHHAIQAINPSVTRPEDIEKEVRAETKDLLPRLGVEVEGQDSDWPRHVARILRSYMKVDKSEDDFTQAVFQLLEEIERKAFAVDGSAIVSDFDDNVVANQSVN